MMLGEQRTPQGSKFRYADIVDWASTRGLELRPAVLSRHYKNHVQSSVRAMLEVQANTEAISAATNKRLSPHAVFANVITSKILRLLDDVDGEQLAAMDLEKLLRVSLMAGRNSLHIEKAEALLTREEVVKEMDQKLERAGLEPETLAKIR